MPMQNDSTKQYRRASRTSTKISCSLTWPVSTSSLPAGSCSTISNGYTMHSRTCRVRFNLWYPYRCPHYPQSANKGGLIHFLDFFSFLCYDFFVPPHSSMGQKQMSLLLTGLLH